MDYDFQHTSDLEWTREVFENEVRRMGVTVLAGVKTATDYMMEAHRTQTRADGLPYAIHPLRTALLCVSFGCIEYDVLCTALLHDVLEDPSHTLDDVMQVFGNRVGEYMSYFAVAKPTNESADGRKERKLRQWARILRAGPEVRLVKVCDNLDNMISWKFIAKDSPAYHKLPRWLMQAREFYLPLAAMTSERAFELSISELKWYYEHGHTEGGWYSDGQ